MMTIPQPHPKTLRQLTEADDATLIAEIAHGDKQAGEVLLTRYHRLLQKVVASSGLPITEKEDLYQMIIQRLWEENARRLRLWKGEGSFAAYLWTVTRRLVLDCRDRWRIRQGVRWEEVERVVHCDEDVTRRIYLRQLWEATLLALERLTPREAALLRARYLEGRSYKELASEFDMTVNHVGVALMRVEKRLRRVLQQQQPTLFEEAIC